jgi:hypothetical protein
VTGVLMKAKTFNSIKLFNNTLISDERTYDINRLNRLFANFGQETSLPEN